MICQKGGCRTEATIHVVLQDADGRMEWDACYFHAKAFERWVFEESRKQDASAGSVWLTSKKTGREIGNA